MKAKPNEQKLAPFAELKPAPVDSPVWPVHALLWLQPAVAPVRPRTSGLRVERRFKPPAPDFLRSQAGPAAACDARQHACQPHPPNLRRPLPSSGLAPLGWDPRSACPSPREKGSLQ